MVVGARPHKGTIAPVFIVAAANVQVKTVRSPLQGEKPQTITLRNGKKTFFFPDTITVSRQSDNRTYNLDERRVEGIKTARYIYQRESEIWQIKATNLIELNFALWGVSNAQPLWLEIQQFIEANVNNYSLLRRGGRPSLGWAWTGSSPMSDAQFVRAQQELKKYEGAANAGRMAIIDLLKPEPII